MKAIKVVDELNKFLTETLKELSVKEQIETEINFHSNVQPTTNNQKMRVYINRKIIREGQDTLAIDVEDFGRVRYTSEGVYGISFFVPRNLSGSYGKMERTVQELKNALRQKRFDCMWVRHITASPFDMENNSYRYELTFNYEFDEVI